MPHLYEPSNVLRLFTGTGMGLIIASILYPAFIGSVYIDSDTQPAIVGFKSMLIVSGFAILVDLLHPDGVEICIKSCSIHQRQRNSSFY